MQTYSYGHDFGNAETCGVTFIGKRKASKSVPTAIATGQFDRLVNIGYRMQENDFVFQWAGKGTEFFVGDLAIEQANASFNGRGDISRYWSEKSLQMLLTVASSLISDSEFGLNVVTGLPVQTYLGNSECRKKIKQALEGTHEFYVNRRKRIVHIQVERIIMEGAGATIAYGSRGKERQAVIDIGGRTTDLFVAEGQKPYSQLCDGKALGVEIAGELFKSNFKDKYRYDVRDSLLKDIMHAYANKTAYPPVFCKGTPIADVEAKMIEAMNKIGDDILSFISSTWSSTEADSQVASDFSSVLCIGGGAYYFYDRIREIIPHAVFVESPEQANAYGYCLFAEQQLNRLRAVA